MTFIQIYYISTFSIKNFSDCLIAFHKVMGKGVVTAFLSFNLHTHTHPFDGPFPGLPR